MAQQDPTPSHYLRDYNFRIMPELLDDIYAKLLNINHSDSITQQMLAMETYELAIGIQRNDGTENPNALMTFKESTDCYIGSAWERTLDVLVDAKLHQSTGLNIMEQLDLPRPMLKRLLKAVAKNARKEAPIMRELEKRAEQAGINRAKNLQNALGYNF